MRFQLLISCNNAAFGEDPSEAAAEVSRILKSVIERLQDDSIEAVDVEQPLRDANGNKVGAYAFISSRADQLKDR